MLNVDGQDQLQKLMLTNSSFLRSICAYYILSSKPMSNDICSYGCPLNTSSIVSLLHYLVVHNNLGPDI